MSQEIIQSIIPRDEQHWLELRCQDITSTEAAALFGCSPYQSLFELWHRKRDNTIVRLEENERMKWGTRLQDAIAAGVAEEHGWTIRRMDEYKRLPDLRMGSSFDFEITSAEGLGILEIKNVDGLVFREHWAENEDGTHEAPPHIELQVQHQLAVSGYSYAYIGALVGGNRLVLIRRTPNQDIIASLRKAAADFWATVDAGTQPVPDFARDAKFIQRLYGYASPGSVADRRGDAQMAALVTQYKAFSASAKDAETGREQVKAQMLQLIGDAEKVLGDGWSISSGMIGESEVHFVRKAYRNFKVNTKKTH